MSILGTHFHNDDGIGYIRVPSASDPCNIAVVPGVMNTTFVYSGHPVYNGHGSGYLGVPWALVLRRIRCDTQSTRCKY